MAAAENTRRWRGIAPAPLHHRYPRYRRDQRIHRRQQDRDGQFPDAVYVLDQASVLTCPAGPLHRGEAAGEEKSEQHQLGEQQAVIEALTPMATASRTVTDTMNTASQPRISARLATSGQPEQGTWRP